MVSDKGGKALRSTVVDYCSLCLHLSNMFGKFDAVRTGIDGDMHSHCENAVFFVRMTLADTHLLKKVISGS